MVIFSTTLLKLDMNQLTYSEATFCQAAMGSETARKLTLL